MIPPCTLQATCEVPYQHPSYPVAANLQVAQGSTMTVALIVSLHGHPHRLLEFTYGQPGRALDGEPGNPTRITLAYWDPCHPRNGPHKGIIHIVP